MASDNKIVSELFSQFNQIKYDKYCQYLIDCDSVSLDYFKSTELGLRYWIDLCRCFVNDQLNANHVLEIFSKYSDQDPEILWQCVLDIVEQDQEIWKSVGRVVLSMKFTTLDDWIKDMRSSTCQCDEFMLFVLSRIHCQHTIVYTYKCPWSTIDSDLPLTPDELHSACDVHLVYLGSYIFGELRLSPMCTAPALTYHAMDISLPSKSHGGQHKPLNLSSSASSKKTAKSQTKSVIKKSKPTSCVADLNENAGQTVDEILIKEDNCSHQSGSSTGMQPSTTVTVEVITPKICSNQTSPNSDLDDANRPVHSDNDTVPYTNPAISPSMRTVHTLRNLRSLSTKVLNSTFPGKDPLQVANLYADME